MDAPFQARIYLRAFFCHTETRVFLEIRVMPAGRPTDYRPEYCERVIEHMSEGASLTSFAASINCARSSINVWMEANPEFSEAVKIAKAKCASWWELRGRQGATGQEDVNPTLVIFGLKNMAADDWRERREVDHTSSDRSMSPNIDESELDSRIAELINKANS